MNRSERAERAARSKVKRANVPPTADAPENLNSGVLIVVPAGFGPEIRLADPDGQGELDGAEAMELTARRKLEAARGVITAPRVDRGPEITELLKWLEAAGFPVRREAKRFSILSWPEKLAHIQLDRRTIKLALAELGRLKTEIEKRRPLIVVFLSAQLLDAANDPSAVAALADSAGIPLEPVRRITSVRLRATAQRWEHVLMLGLPIPRRSLSDETRSAIVEAIRSAFRREDFLT